MQVQQKEDHDIYYSNYVNALKSKTTKNDYTKRLSYFMDFLGIKNKNYYELVENRDKKWIENNIINFLIYLRKERKISYRSASHYLDSIKKFYYVNSEYEFKWKLIQMYLGDDDDDYDNDSKQIEEDRPYTKQEIQTMLKTATDIRAKIIILLISSAGIRVGGIAGIKLRNLKRIEKYNLYQITVYEKSKKSNYKTFCTPECAQVIDTYLQYRKHAGEILKPESPLIREQFNPSDEFKVKNPKNIGTDLLKYLVNEVLTKYSALKQKLEYDYKNKRSIGRNSTMLTHGLRKYFDTESRKAGVYPDLVEILMGHKLPGVRKHYFKPGINDINELLEGTADCKGYVTAINELTINDEFRLKRENQELTKKKQETEYIIKGKLQEMEEQNQFLISRLQEYEEAYQEGRIMSKEYKKHRDVQYQRLAKLEAKFDELLAAQDKERKLDSDYEIETDFELKDQKFDKMLSATRETIKKRSKLEKTFRE